MPRDVKGIRRKSGGQSKDPYRIFVLAMEGEQTEPRYFQWVKNKLESLKIGRLVKIEPQLRPKGTSGHFQDVIATLDEYVKKYTIAEGDELWCIVDRDNQIARNIAEAVTLCRQKGFEFCMTTPCFEFWLLLHLNDLSLYGADELQALLENNRIMSGERTVTEHHLHLGLQAHGEPGYRKNRIPAIFLANIPVAVKRSFELNLDSGVWRTDQFHTRLHILLQRIFSLESPDYLLPEQ